MVHGYKVRGRLNGGQKAEDVGAYYLRMLWKPSRLRNTGTTMLPESPVAPCRAPRIDQRISRLYGLGLKAPPQR